METQQTQTSAAPTAAPAQAALSRVTVGSVLGRSFKTLLKTPGCFFGLTLAVMVPIAVIAGLLPPDAGIVANILLSAIFGLVIQGAIAYGVFQVLVGNKPGIGNALSRGFARFFPLAGAAILMILGIGIGMLLLVVPGVILACIWAVTIPACMVEKKGAIASMKRSAELTKGYRWQIFGLFLITGIIIAVINGVLTVFLFSLVGGNLIVIDAISSLVVALPQTLQYVMVATIYYDLRAEKEGVSIDSLTNIFD